MGQQPRGSTAAFLPAVGVRQRQALSLRPHRSNNGRRSSSGRHLQTCATVLWSLEAQADWCAASAELCAQTLPVDLTAIIDQKRPGPCKSGQCSVGAAAEGGDVVLNVDTVSSFHAVFEQDGDTGNLFVTDLNSTNGTFVNGEQIGSGEKVRLSPGDSLAFGPEPVFIVLRNIFAHA